jgi:hypothetical protein
MDLNRHVRRRCRFVINRRIIQDSLKKWLGYGYARSLASGEGD